MKKFLLSILLLLALAAPALAGEVANHYGLWQVRTQVGGVAYEPFLLGIGDRPYSQDAQVQWDSPNGAAWLPAEYNQQGNYYYTRVEETGWSIYSYDRNFVDNGWVSAHPGWIVRGAMYLDVSAGQDWGLDVYLSDPGITTMHKSLGLALDFNSSYSHADLSGIYYDFATGGSRWRQGVSGHMEKIGSYTNGGFTLF